MQWIIRIYNEYDNYSNIVQVIQHRRQREKHRKYLFTAMPARSRAVIGRKKNENISLDSGSTCDTVLKQVAGMD